MAERRERSGRNMLMPVAHSIFVPYYLFNFQFTIPTFGEIPGISSTIARPGSYKTSARTQSRDQSHDENYTRPVVQSRVLWGL